MKKSIRIIGLLCIVSIVFVLCSCSNITNITLSDSDITLTVGQTRQIEVSAVPENAVLNNLTWSSSDSAIVSVEDGLLKGLKKGTSVIKVVTSNGISKSCNVTVVEEGISNIALSPQTLTLDAGKTSTIKVTLTPADANKSELTWSSDDKSVAVVNSSGTVTAIGSGTTNITCSATSGIEASCTITVKGASSDKATIIYQYGHYNPSYVYNTSDFVFPESSIRKLTTSEIESTLRCMTGGPIADSYAQDAINEIYARNGYVFKTASIRNYYESKPWYYADSTFTTSKFSSIENYNIKLLERYS